ncbi:hypothetical protein GQ457_04G016460 [Hibiscus cannabinus]
MSMGPMMQMTEGVRFKEEKNGVRNVSSAMESFSELIEDLALVVVSVQGGASETQIRNVVRILKGFELVALKLNLNKSKMIGINVGDPKTEYWASLLHCTTEKLPCQYSGLPLGAQKNLVFMWSPIVEMFRKRLVGWKSKMLSFGGRLTLGAYDIRVIYWIRWETMCLPKSCGGLGLVNFKFKNKSLLNKCLWRFGTEPDSLWRKVINAKYEENEASLLPANLETKNKSWI